MEMMHGRYIVQKVIKTDGKGMVCLVRHKTLGIDRIAKCSNGQMIYDRKLLNEAYILGGLHHPYIPSVCDMETEEGSVCLVEEKLEGVTLYEYIRNNGVLQQDKVLEYGVKLAKIIDFLHSGNSFRVCHLDIQPNNIIINENKKEIYLIDFGNAITDRVEDFSLGVMVTEGFAPPEQYNDSFGKNVEESMTADIYGLGAVLLYMLTGTYGKDIQLDFEGKDELKLIISDMTAHGKTYRQRNVKNVISGLETLSSVYSENCKIAEEYTGGVYRISVYGVRAGAGATFVSMYIAKILGKMGISAVYAEENDSNFVRKMAETYRDIVFDRGYFIWNKIRLKPKYRENIRLEESFRVEIADRGIWRGENCEKDMMHDECNIKLLVCQADTLGYVHVQNILRNKPYGEYGGGSLYLIFNRCGGDMYRMASSKVGMGIRSDYIPELTDDIWSDGENMWELQRIMERIANECSDVRTVTVKQRGGENSEKSLEEGTGKGGKKHWSGVRKKR